LKFTVSQIKIQFSFYKKDIMKEVDKVKDLEIKNAVP